MSRGVHRSFIFHAYPVEVGGTRRVAVFGEEQTGQVLARRRAEDLAALSERFARADSTDDIQHLVTTELRSFLRASASITQLRYVEPSHGPDGELDARKVADELGVERSMVDATIGGRVAVRPDRRASDGTDDRPRQALVPCTTSDGRTVGFLAAAWADTHDEAGVSLAEFLDIGRLVGGVAERIELNAQRRAVVEELQHFLLETPKDPPGAELAVRYRPAATAAGLGGDWFDVIRLGGARTALVIGDVSGHGPAAAAAMSQISSTLRPLLVIGHPLADVFDLADRVLDEAVSSVIATVAIVVLDAERRTIDAISAGHPPAALITPDGEIELLAAGLRPPLGTYPGRAQPARIAYRPGSTVVLFTDGLVETRSGSLDDDLARLVEYLGATAGAFPHRLADHLIDDFGVTTGRFDDAAVLVARLTSDAGPTSTDLDLR